MSLLGVNEFVLFCKFLLVDFILSLFFNSVLLLLLLLFLLFLLMLLLCSFSFGLLEFLSDVSSLSFDLLPLNNAIFLSISSISTLAKYGLAEAEYGSNGFPLNV